MDANSLSYWLFPPFFCCFLFKILFLAATLYECIQTRVQFSGERASTSNEISYEYYLLLCRSTDAITIWISSNFFSFFCPLFMYHKSVICSAPPGNSIADALMLIHTIHIWLWCIQMLIFLLSLSLARNFLLNSFLLFALRRLCTKNSSALTYE